MKQFELRLALHLLRNVQHKERKTSPNSLPIRGTCCFAFFSLMPPTSTRWSQAILTVFGPVPVRVSLLFGIPLLITSSRQLSSLLKTKCPQLALSFLPKGVEN